MTTQFTILAPLDAEDLMNHGLMGPGRTAGSSRLHKRRLNRYSDFEYQDISLDIPLSSPNADYAFTTIPVSLISRESLIYCGLSEAKATMLWEQWTNWPAQGPRRETDPDDGGLVVTFKDFILGSFENQADAADDSQHEWRECLNRCGIAIDVQDAILDPLFEDMYLSETCLFWASATVEMRYAGLESIQRTSRERESQLRQVAGTE